MRRLPSPWSMSLRTPPLWTSVSSNIFISARGGEGALPRRVHDRLLDQGYLPFRMRRAPTGCGGAVLESRRSRMPAAQNGEPDGRSGNRV